ncbi:hypothetical protein H1C71_042492 [Ictidomys tridecemlineatus]|nr:hypothetical protein H1C71_042492 [Ictidomys tridecemlineatus]
MASPALSLRLSPKGQEKNRETDRGSARSEVAFYWGTLFLGTFYLKKGKRNRITKEQVSVTYPQGATLTPGATPYYSSGGKAQVTGEHNNCSEPLASGLKGMIIQCDSPHIPTLKK